VAALGARGVFGWGARAPIDALRSA
jgi:hypothetical protein